MVPFCVEVTNIESNCLQTSVICGSFSCGHILEADFVSIVIRFKKFLSTPTFQFAETTMRFSVKILYFFQKRFPLFPNVNDVIKDFETLRKVRRQMVDN